MANNNNNYGPEGLLDIGSEHKLRSENLAFDIDVWYPSLKDFTFLTEFIPFTKREALAILNYQHYAFNERKNKFSKEDVEVLLSLQKRIQKVLNSNFSSKRGKRKGTEGAFLRLCGRSPKDAEPFNRTKLLQNYTKSLDEIRKNSEKDYQNLHFQLDDHYKDINNRLRATSKVQWLKVTSSEDAMSLLLTSERVFADLHDWLEWGEPEQIVLREWDDQITMEYEFRAFIHKNKLNAISQYDHYCIYPSLFPLQEIIKEKIIEMWERVHEKVGVESYVMDFIFYPNNQSVKVIEISPFLRCTGAACFNWVNDKDVMENGPLEFRLNINIHPQLEDLIISNWDLRWEKKAQNYETVLQQFVALRSKKKVYSLITILLIFISLLLFTKVNVVALEVTALLLALGYLFYYRTFRLTKKKKKYLFVYGTLKRNFHWNSKYMSRCKFIATAKTRTAHHLVVGESGVPYLLDDTEYFKQINNHNQNFEEKIGKVIEGEIWQVDDIALSGLDEYEGIHKGYYIRKSIPVQRIGRFFSSYTIADAYFKTDYQPALWNSPRLSVYSLEYHRANYKPIKHILVKQEKYLSVPDSEIKS